MYTPSQYGTPFSVTATHGSLASASKAGVSGTTYYVTDVCVTSDKAGSVLLVKQGTTTIWQAQVGAGSYSYSFSTPLVGASGALVSAEVDGTSLCKANIAGFAL